jgi:hypothetical protein
VSQPVSVQENVSFMASMDPILHSSLADFYRKKPFISRTHLRGVS